MKQVCVYCGRTSPDSNLWCQETYCKAELSPHILTYGEPLADLVVVKPLVVLRSSVLYRARQGDSPVLLKVAHAEQHERLQREARFLMELRGGKAPARPRRGADQPAPATRQYPALPVLLPPHRDEDLAKYYYGKTVLRGETKYYTLFQDIEGEPLRLLLARNPQPWFRHVGQMMVGLADAVALMHYQQVFHLCLSPDVVLLRHDTQDIPRPTLIDLGAVVGSQEANLYWDNWLTPLAYRPPEVVQSGRIASGQAADVYGLGAILYELLAGRPVYAFQQRSDADIRQSVLHESPEPLNRSDLAGLPEIAEQAIAKNPGDRQESVLTFLGQLQRYFPAAPQEKPPRRIDWRLVFIICGVLTAIALLILLALTFQAGG